jgi:hypothetical protein
VALLKVEKNQNYLANVHQGYSKKLKNRFTDNKNQYVVSLINSSLLSQYFKLLKAALDLTG